MMISSKRGKHNFDKDELHKTTKLNVFMSETLKDEETNLKRKDRKGRAEEERGGD